MKTIFTRLMNLSLALVGFGLLPLDAQAQCFPIFIEYRSYDVNMTKIGHIEYGANPSSKRYLKETITESADDVPCDTDYGDIFLELPNTAYKGKISFSSSLTWSSYANHIEVVYTYNNTSVNAPYNTNYSNPGSVNDNNTGPYDVAANITARIDNNSYQEYSYPRGPVTFTAGYLEIFFDVDDDDLGTIEVVYNTDTYSKSTNGSFRLSSAVVTDESIYNSTLKEIATSEGFTPAKQSFVLSQEYTTEMLDGCARSHLSSYGTADWGKTVSITANENGIPTPDRQGAAKTAAYRHLNDDEDQIELHKLEYRLKFVIPKGQVQTIEWEEKFTPTSGGTVVITKKSETLTGTGKLQYSSLHTLNPPTADGTTTVEVPKSSCSAGFCDIGSDPIGGDDSGPNLNADNGGTFASISLGMDAEGNSQGQIQITGEGGSPLLATPGQLELLADSSVDAIYNQGVLYQVKSAGGLAVVTDDSPGGGTKSFKIDIYTNPGPIENGYYTFSGTPYKTWTVSNGGDANTLIITAPNSSPTTYTWTSDPPSWSQSSGSGLRYSQTSWSDSTRTRTVYQDSGHTSLVYQEQEVYLTTTNAQGAAVSFVTQRLVGTGSAVRTNIYIPILSTTNPNFGQMEWVIDSQGGWQYYQYDTSQRVVEIIAGFGNAPTSSVGNVSLCRQTVYSYTALDASDDLSLSPGEPRTVSEYVLGNLVSRTFTLITPTERRDIRAYSAAATWDNANNLVTITREYCNTNGTSTNIVWVRESNGTLRISLTTTNDQGLKLEWTLTGSPDGTGTNVLDGTRTLTSYTADGLVSSRATVAVINGVEGMTLEHVGYLYEDDDNPYRPSLVTNYLNGTCTINSYDCCVIEATQDTEGIVTSYQYDSLKRLTNTVRNGVSSHNVLDAAGHVLASYTIGAQGHRLTNYLALYNPAGELYQQTDARGQVTTFNNYFEDGYFVRHTIYPDTSERLEWYFLDGQLYEVTGSAAVPVRYSYGADADGAYTLEIKMIGTSTNEWTKTCHNLLGQVSKTVQSATASTTVERTFEYNNLGQLTQETDPDGVVTEYGYNGLGEQYIRTTGDRQQVVIRDYYMSQDQKNYQRTRQYAAWPSGSNLVATTLMRVDGLESLQTIHINDQDDATTSSLTTYNAAAPQRQVKTTAADNTYTVSSYQNGFLVSVKRYDSQNELISGSNFGYDEYGRQQIVEDLRTGTQTIQVLGPGDLVATNRVLAAGLPEQATRYTYNNRGWATTTIHPDGQSSSQTYYTNGLRNLTSGAHNYQASYAYDDQGRMVNLVTYPEGGAGVTTVWEFNPYTGRMENKKYDTSTNGPSYTYTPAGRLATRTWARGITTTYATNLLGEVASISYGGAMNSLQFGRDPQGRLQAVTNGVAEAYLSYNGAGQRVGESYENGTLDGLLVTNVYNSQLQLQSVGLKHDSTNMTEVGYEYDEAGRLQTVTAGSLSATYSYLPTSTLISAITLKSGGSERLAITRGFDALNRLKGITNKPSAVSALSFTYAYNLMNQRTRATLADGSQWEYQYNSRDELTNAVHHWADAFPVAGQQFGYDFDGIGNRKWARRDGRQSDYAVNSLFQYTSRTVPGYANILGTATNKATVTVNNTTTSRKGDYYRTELAVNNSTAPVWLGVTNLGVLRQGMNPDLVTTNTGRLFVPQTPEAYTYDEDGNLTSDGQWTNRWDAENRLIEQETMEAGVTAGAPKQKLVYEYDWMNRRIAKTVYAWQTDQWQLSTGHRFVYDGWNLVAILDAPSSTLLASFIWGTDLSGSMQGAGGVGGLLAMIVHTGANAGGYFFAYDGNGNVVALVNAATGELAAEYEYSPFGELLRATGPLAIVNPFRFSTKYQDDETGLLYYGHRYYNPSTGRWPSRDPIGERGGRNLYGFINNKGLNAIDFLGQEIQTTKVKLGWGIPVLSPTVIMDVEYACDTSPDIIGTTISAYQGVVVVGLGFTANSGINSIRKLEHGCCKTNGVSGRWIFYQYKLDYIVHASINIGIGYGNAGLEGTVHTYQYANGNLQTATPSLCCPEK